MIKNASVKAQRAKCFQLERETEQAKSKLYYKKKKKRGGRRRRNVKALRKGKMSSSPGKYRKI